MNISRLVQVVLWLSLIIPESRIATAQNPSVSIGNWRIHNPYNKAIAVCDGNGEVFCASRFGLFSYNKSSGETELFSRISGLSDYEISGIRYNPADKIVLVAYQSSNIDLILPDHSIVNLSDIKRKNIIGGKKINCILFVNHLAYLGCEFGIVVIDLDRKEVKDTYYIGENGGSMDVVGLAYDGNYLLAATDSGLLQAGYNDPNIFNYNAWSRDTTIYDPYGSYSSAAAVNGQFVVTRITAGGTGDSVLIHSNGSWGAFIPDDVSGAMVDSYNNYLLYRNIYKTVVFDGAGAVIKYIDINSYQGANPVSGFADAQSNFWVADGVNGLVLQPASGGLRIIAPNGPASESVWSLDSKGGYTWVASGALTGDAPNYSVQDGIYLMHDNFWKSFNRSNDAVYNDMCNSASPSVVCVAVDPSDKKHAFAGSWGGGVLEYGENGGIKRYDESNSPLKSINGLNNYIIVGGMTFDSNNDLWVVAGGTTSPLYVKRSGSGNWESFVIPDADMSHYGLYQIIADDYGQKWFIARDGASSGQGLGVFNENDPQNPNDNSFTRFINQTGKGGLPDNFVWSLAKDKDGAIWIGTSKGVVVVYNPGNVFSGGNYDAQKIILEQDGYAQYLLETEFVTAIAVDGGNRKWFGTYSGGVFLMSADGTKQLLHFNTENSPLPSNTIKSIAIDELSGEVFIGTEKGIVSYRAEATEGSDACDNYYVYPNPVKHEYHGPIAIRGLVTDADVKITDVAGNLVYHTRALGGQAIWNGTNFNGERIQTGIYTVFISNDDGSQTCTTKVLFAN